MEDIQSPLSADYYFVSLEHSRMTLYEDESMKTEVEHIDLDGMQVEFVPRDLRGFEMFSKDFPLCIRPKADSSIYRKFYVDDMTGRLRVSKKKRTPSSASGRKRSIIANNVNFNGANTGNDHLYIYNCSALEKEDWFIRLSVETNAVDVRQINVKRDINTIVSATDDSVPQLGGLLSGEKKIPSVSAFPNDSAWFSALMHRVYDIDDIHGALVHHLFSIIEQKIRRAAKSSFMGHLRLSKVELDQLPKFSRFQLLSNDSLDSGLRCDFNVDFEGSFAISVETDFMVDALLTTVTLPIALTVKLSHLSGKGQFWIKPKPSNRVWIGFHSTPRYKLDVIPQVSTAQMRISLLTDLFQNLIDTVLQDSLVLPNMGDISLDDDKLLDCKTGFKNERHVEDNLEPEPKPASVPRMSTTSRSPSPTTSIIKKNPITKSISRLDEDDVQPDPIEHPVSNPFEGELGLHQVFALRQRKSVSPTSQVRPVESDTVRNQSPSNVSDIANTESTGTDSGIGSGVLSR